MLDTMDKLMDVLLQVLPTIITGILAYVMYSTRARYAQEMAEQKRISTEQNDAHALRIQALQNENTQTQAQLEIIKEFAAGVPKNQETWQSVLNNMSARRLEGDKEIAGALREIASINRTYTQEIDDFGSILEIHTTTHGALTKKIDDSMYTFVETAKVTNTTVDSQKEELQLLIKSNDTLASRLDDLIAIDESHVLDEGTRHEILRKDNSEHKAELVAIKNALLTGNSILENILKRIEGSTQPLPAPETWNEETETTAIIPPKKLVDEDGNVKSLPLAGNDTPENLDKAS